MNRNTAKQLLPIIQAFSEGKPVQSRCIKGDTSLWYDDEDHSFDDDFEYRIKPEPKYRPFYDNAEECWEEMKKHQPFGWIKSKEDGSRSLITLVISEENIDINCIGGFNSDKIMKRFTFDDGAVFGILEEE